MSSAPSPRSSHVLCRLFLRQHAQMTCPVKRVSGQGVWCRAWRAPVMRKLPMRSPRSVNLRFATTAFRCDLTCSRVIEADAAAALTRCPEKPRRWVAADDHHSEPMLRPRQAPSR